MPKRLELPKGTRFGYLRVIEEVAPRKDKRRFKCLCDCGSYTEVSLSCLRTGSTSSCGCLRKRHGDKGTPLYQVWAYMKQRCLNKKDTAYRSYGGRGIEVCERWHDYINFREDMGAGYKHGLDLDRKDNDGPYSPENCRWVTRKQNARNRRTNRLLSHAGKTMCLIEWSESTGIERSTITKRLDAGWSIEKALTTPVANRAQYLSE